MRNRAGMTPLIVQEIVRETPTIVSVVLADPEGRRLPPRTPERTSTCSSSPATTAVLALR